MITREQVIEELKKVEDPELYLDIWFLGLVYGIEIEPMEDHPDSVMIKITMTFTSPACPAGPILIDDVKTRLKALPGVQSVQVTITFEPAWTPSDEVKGLLGMM